MKTRKTEKGDIEKVKQKFLQSHFLHDKGFLEDVQVRLIDKTQGSDPTKREYYWMRTLKTLYPDGLNIESDYFLLCSLGNVWQLATLTFSWEPKIVFYLKVLEVYCASCIL